MKIAASTHLTNGCTGQISAVTFFAKTRKKSAIKNLLGEPGVKSHMNLKRAWVDQDVCGAFQLCIGEAPSHFEETDGIASRVIATDSPFTVSDLRSLVSGAWSCPLGAIYIELESGEVLNEITEAQYAQYVENS